MLLAAPVAQYPALLARDGAALGPHTHRHRRWQHQAGRDRRRARRRWVAVLPRFVPGHPIAGTEQSGAAAAFSTLYAERNVVLTPLAETDPLALATVAAAWTDLRRARAHARRRARTTGSSPRSRICRICSRSRSSTSSPRRPDAEDLFRFAASGFRDFTRIAASSPEMWRDIALANRAALLSEIAAFRAQLDRVAAMVATADGAALEAVFARARAARRAWDAQRNAAENPAPDGAREPG